MVGICLCVRDMHTEAIRHQPSRGFKDAPGQQLRIVMELGAGTLGHVIAQGGRMSEGEVFFCTHQIYKALVEGLHAHSLIYCDLKTDNILFSATKPYRLM